MQEVFTGFESILSRQSHVLCGKSIDISIHEATLKKAKDRYLYCLSRKKIKHFSSHILRHADEYASFLFFV